MAVKREKVRFESVEELLGAPIAADVTEEIEINHIHPFKNHPFKVADIFCDSVIFYKLSEPFLKVIYLVVCLDKVNALALSVI